MVRKSLHKKIAHMLVMRAESDAIKAAILYTRFLTFGLLDPGGIKG
jgi:hypothetical protein